MDWKIMVPPDWLRAAMLFENKKATKERNYESVAVDMTGDAPVIVATDANCLIAVRAAYVMRPAKPMTVPLPGAAVAIVSSIASQHGESHVEMEASGREMVFRAGGIQTVCDVPDGLFPQWRKIVPRTVNGQAAELDERYLAAFRNAQYMLCGGERGSMRVHHNGAMPAVVTFPGIPAIGLIAPINDWRDPPDYAIPDWIEDARK